MLCLFYLFFALLCLRRMSFEANRYFFNLGNTTGTTLPAMNFLPKIQRMQWEPNLGSVNYMFIRHSAGVFFTHVFIFNTNIYPLLTVVQPQSYPINSMRSLPLAFIYSTSNKYLLNTCMRQTWFLPSWSLHFNKQHLLNLWCSMHCAKCSTFIMSFKPLRSL